MMRNSSQSYQIGYSLWDLQRIWKHHRLPCPRNKEADCFGKLQKCVLYSSSQVGSIQNESSISEWRWMFVLACGFYCAEAAIFTIFAKDAVQAETVFILIVIPPLSLISCLGIRLSTLSCIGGSPLTILIVFSHSSYYQILPILPIIIKRFFVLSSFSNIFSSRRSTSSHTRESPLSTTSLQDKFSSSQRDNSLSQMLNKL